MNHDRDFSGEISKMIWDQFFAVAKCSNWNSYRDSFETPFYMGPLSAGNYTYANFFEIDLVVHRIA